jgi:UDP-3-O-[3-hydroxymyristoyl] glucosamine N-acyltransferase
MPMPLTLTEIAAQVRGEIVGDASTNITGFAPADHARAGDLTFADKDAYFAAAERGEASAILVSGPFTSDRKPLIRVANARVAVARLLPLFFPPDEHAAGVHPSAVIDPSAKLDPSVHIGPNCVIGPRARLGARCVLMGGNHIGRDCQLGDDVTLHPNALLYPRTQVGNRVTIHGGTVIGSDGYGYVLDEGRHRKVLQVGNVVIHDDVEIGANAAIDRAALGSTVIGKGTKIDNLVHVAHNVVMGNHCLIMGQVGFAGSTRLGDYCVIAAQAGIAGHLTLGRQSTVGAKSGVMRDIPDGVTVLGIPAQPDKQIKRQWIALQKLPDMMRELRDLQHELEQLKAARSSPQTM